MRFTIRRLQPSGCVGNELAAKERTSSTSHISCRQIPDSVGDRVWTQVTLHELAEQFDDRPWACEQANAFHLFGSISVTRMAIWIRLPSMLPSNVTMYRPSGFWNSCTFRGIP